MSNGRTVSYTYDELGNKVGIGYPDESTAQYEYDKNSRMTKVTDGDSKVSTYVYDANGNLTKKTLSNGWVEEYTYDPADRKTRVDDTNPFPSPKKLMKNIYSYDANGNLMQECRRETTDPGSEQNYQWTYDKLNQITSTTIKAEGKPTVKTSYEYDTVGNMSYQRTGTGLKGCVSYEYNGLRPPPLLLVATLSCFLAKLLQTFGKTGNNQNQLAYKLVDGNDNWYYTYDKRGNLLKEEQCGPYATGNETKTTGTYRYNAANRFSLCCGQCDVCFIE